MTRPGADGGVTARRVVITGIGVVNAVCTGGSAAIGPVLETGRSAIARVAAFSTDDLPSHCAAELPSSSFASLVESSEARRLSRISQMALAAARLAMQDANLASMTGALLIVGSEFGDLRSTEEFAAGFLRRGAAGLSALAFPNTVMNTMAAATAIALGLRGPSITLNARRVSGELAVARAAALIAAGRASTALAGGVDEISPLVFGQLARLRALSPRDGGEEACRPFDRHANGPVRGEGAAFLVLESLDSARVRGARLLGEIRAAAWRSGPRANAIPEALESAGLAPRDIGWIYGGGPGEPGEDRAELAAVRAAFRESLPALTSLSPVAGEHAGLGVLGVAAAAWTARAGRLPGVASLREPTEGARDLAAGPGVHRVPAGAGLVHRGCRRGDSVALIVSPV